MKKLTVNLKNNISNYDIVIKNGAALEFCSCLEGKKYFVITNSKIAKIYADFLKNFPKERVIIIKDGEKYKNNNTYNFIINELLKAKIERADCIIAFGGGVVGDLAGFCAATILRGVDFINIPTTLLSQTDSSIGGKTGFNTANGKNLIGAFWQPRKVIVDPLFLKTLSKREFQCGMGEIVKYALIEKSCRAKENFNLFEQLEKINSETLWVEIENIIYACITLKVSVVEKDEKEVGLRKILNLGHTFGHAYEKITNYKKYSHGEAVMLGLKTVLCIALKNNSINNEYYTKCINLIDKYNETTFPDNIKKEDVMKIIENDKKIVNGKINLIIPAGFASVELFDNIDAPLIKDCLP